MRPKLLQSKFGETQERDRTLQLSKHNKKSSIAESKTSECWWWEDLIRRDRKVRAKLASHVRERSSGHFKVNQSDFDVKDFQFAFGETAKETRG